MRTSSAASFQLHIMSVIALSNAKLHYVLAARFQLHIVLLMHVIAVNCPDTKPSLFQMLMLSFTRDLLFMTFLLQDSSYTLPWHKPLPLMSVIGKLTRHKTFSSHVCQCSLKSTRDHQLSLWHIVLTHSCSGQRDPNQPLAEQAGGSSN